MPNYYDVRQVTDNFIDSWAHRVKPSLTFKGKDADDVDIWKKKLIRKVKQLLGEFPRPAELSPELLSCPSQSVSCAPFQPCTCASTQKGNND